jgi:hypothetical protein
MQDLNGMPPDGGVVDPTGQAEPVDAGQGEGEQRPDESDEARGDMPKESSAGPFKYALPTPGLEKTELFQNHERMKSLADEHRPKVKVPVAQEGAETPEAIQRKQAVGLYQGPRHLGMRRHIRERDINKELQA